MIYKCAGDIAESYFERYNHSFLLPTLTLYIFYFFCDVDRSGSGSYTFS